MGLHRHAFVFSSGGLRFGQHGIHFGETGAGILQQGSQLLDGSLGVVHHALLAKYPNVGLGEQGIGLVQSGNHAFGIRLAAQHRTQYAVFAGQAGAQATGHGLQIGQTVVQAGIRRRDAFHVFKQGAGGGHQFGDFGRGITAQHSPFSPWWQGWVRQHAAESAYFGVSHHAFFHGENAGGSQPFGIFGRHVDGDAHFAVVVQVNAPYASDRKAREGQIHANQDAFGVFRDQHQRLGVFKYATRHHHVSHECRNQQGNKRQKQHRLDFQVGNWPGCRG